jgi:hypothetical protein
MAANRMAPVESSATAIDSPEGVEVEIGSQPPGVVLPDGETIREIRLLVADGTDESKLTDALAGATPEVVQEIATLPLLELIIPDPCDTVQASVGFTGDATTVTE